MIEAYLRPAYQRYVVSPTLKWATRFSPNAITLASCLTGVLVAPLLMLNLTQWAVFFLLFSGFFDTLDGTVARATEKTSEIGSMLDIVSDRIVEFAVILGLFAVDPLHRGWLALMMLGSCYLCVTTFLVAGIFTQNDSQKGFHYSSGLIERAEAFLFFIAMILFPDYFFSLTTLFTVLVLLTSYLRVREFVDFKRNRK